MPRELKLWNGRAGCCHNSDDPNWTGIQPHRGHHKIYAAAYSRADLRRLIAEYCGQDPGVTEIRDYWHQGTWGTRMTGIEPERGLWLGKDREPEGTPPVRLI